MEENLPPADQAVVSNESNRALVATKALEIVLQHWLIPDLGWSTTAFEARIPELREEIILFERGDEEERATLRGNLTNNWQSSWDKEAIQNGAALFENMAGQTIIPDGDIDHVSVFISFVQLFIGTCRKLTHGQSLLTLHTKHNLNIVKLYGINVLDLPNTMRFIQCYNYVKSISNSIKHFTPSLNNNNIVGQINVVLSLLH